MFLLFKVHRYSLMISSYVFFKMLKLTILGTLLLTQITILLAAEVRLPNGVIRGREGVTFKSKPYYSFEKIPYASPPIGELRFKAPVPPQNWDEPIDTVLLNVSCYQRDVSQAYYSEDCLYLSVTTPQLPTEENNPGLASLVYIHGGGFVTGSAMWAYIEKFIDEDVILVALNYRLGPFGFLSTEDEIIPGNNGLKDQQLALKWVHDNIELFGGDPDKVTIFGQSAGSASCAYQLLNQESSGLFRGAILESGSFLSPWAFQRNAREIAFEYGTLVDSSFQGNDSQALLELLLSVDAETLNAASNEYVSTTQTVQNLEILQGFNWAPVIEVKNPDAFLTKKMYGLLKASSEVPVPLLMGVTSEEALAFNQDKNSVIWNNGQWDLHLDWLAPDDMGITDSTTRTEVGSKIREIYTGGEPLADHLGDGVRYVSDTAFTRPVIKHAEIHSQLADTYFYQFSYDGSIGHLNVTYENAGHVGHSQELGYIFCSWCDPSGYTESDWLTSERLIKIWTNFAKYQNPTPEPSEVLQNITWPLVSVENGDFYYVDIGENLEIKNHPKKDTYGKWVEIYDSLGYDNFDTY